MSEFLKVYDESGNPLGEVHKAHLQPTTPGYKERLRQRLSYHTLYRAYLSGHPDPICLYNVPLEYYQILKGTPRLLDKIAFFAPDGWSLRCYDGVPTFVKELPE